MSSDDSSEDVLLIRAARSKAEAFLQGLVKTKADAEADTAHLATLTAKQLADGRAAMDAAIASARRMVHALDEALRRAQEAACDDTIDSGPP